jgi:hypothetical protein
LRHELLKKGWVHGDRDAEGVDRCISGGAPAAGRLN